MLAIGFTSNDRHPSSISRLLPTAPPRRPHRPYYSYGWPGPAATAASHRSRISEPSYSSPRGYPLPRVRRLPVVPFLGLAVFHRPGALSVAWSTWSRNDFHRTWIVRGEADSWVHGHNPVFCDLPSKSLCHACCAANLS